MTPEGRVKAKVKRILEKHGAYFFMPVQSGYGAKTLDFLVCVCGRFVGIETKAPGKQPTDLQKMHMREIEDAGGRCFVVDGDVFELEQYLETHAEG